jgi:hypothetical protein
LGGAVGLVAAASQSAHAEDMCLARSDLLGTAVADAAVRELGDKTGQQNLPSRR